MQFETKKINTISSIEVISQEIVNTIKSYNHLVEKFKHGYFVQPKRLKTWGGSIMYSIYPLPFWSFIFLKKTPYLKKSTLIQ